MASPPAALPSSGKPRKVYGMSTLDTFFSSSPPAPKKAANKQETKNSTFAAVVVTNQRRSKRDRQDGSSKAPLRYLDGNNDVSRTKKRTKTKHKTSASKEITKGTIGLVRIGSWDDKSSLSLTAPQKDVFILQEGAVLGRNISNGCHSSASSNKLDLNIPPAAIGVSRKQITVVHVHSDSVTIRHGKTPNSVGLYRYNKEKNKMKPEMHFLASEEETTLFPGDVIEFDNYNRATDRLAKPEHVFRLVTLANDVVTIADDTKCKSVVPPKKKDNQEQSTSGTSDAMEIDSDSPVAAGKKESPQQVFVDSISTPQDSFHSARTSRSLHTTAAASDPSPAEQNASVAAISSKVSDGNNDAPPKKAGATGLNERATESSPATNRRPGTAESGNSESTRTVEVSHEGPSQMVQTARKKAVTDTAAKATTTNKEQSAAEIAPVDSNSASRSATDETIGGDAAIANDKDEAPDLDVTLPVASSGTPIVRTPRVGDRFRAVYERRNDVKDNFLGFACPSWYFGTAIKVKRKARNKDMYSIELQFDDMSTDTIDYPAPDTQILAVEGDEAVVEMDDGSRVVAYEGGLEGLTVGDLVDGYYQAGAENGAWFRGRVASVNSAAGTCDVVYFDKDYERNVPISRRHLCRIERGCSNPVWLENLPFPGGRIVKIGRVVATGENNNTSGHDHPTTLKLKLSDGTLQVKTYNEFVPVAFKHILKSLPKMKIKMYPAVSIEPKMVPKAKTHPIQRRRELRAAEMERYADVESDVDCRPGIARQEVQDKMTREITVPPTNDISASVCTTFFGAIRSTQPHVGTELLSQLLTSFNSVPTASLTKTLYEITIFGPKHDGTFYPDPHKTELVVNYLNGACSRNLDMRRRLNELAMEKWESFADVIAQVTEPIYRRPGDESSGSNAALCRIANSLQVVANGLSLVLDLIEYQLKPFIDNSAEAGQLREQPVVQALRDHDGGVREALKFVVRMNAQAWIIFGHFCVCDLKKLYAHQPRPAQANVQCCEKQARRVLEKFGKLTSYVAWVYSVEEGVSMDTKNFASVIADVVRTEVKNTKVDVDPYATEKDKIKKAAVNEHWENVMLEFALCLAQEDEEFAVPLQVKVAEVLGLRRKHSSLFGL